MFFTTYIWTLLLILFHENPVSKYLFKKYCPPPLENKWWPLISSLDQNWELSDSFQQIIK